MAKLIDVHSHAILPEYRRAFADAAGQTAPASEVHGYPLPEWSLDGHVETMDANGIDVCILSLPDTEDLLVGAAAGPVARRLNEALATAIAAKPGRFGAFATVPMQEMGAAVEEAAYALDVLGFDGVILSTHQGGDYLGDRRYATLFAELDRRGTVVFVHPTAPPGFDPQRSKLNVAALDFMFDSTRMLASLVLSGTRRRFPNIRIISTHAGGTVPFLAPRIAVVGSMQDKYDGAPVPPPAQIMEDLASIHYDLTASTHPTALDGLRRLVPAEKLLMGFDYPLMPQQTIKPAQTLFARYEGFVESDRQRIMSSNALELFPRFKTALLGHAHTGSSISGGNLLDSDIVGSR